MGLVTETAEIVDLYKKQWAYKQTVSRVSLIEEVGDVLWYIAFGHYLQNMDMAADPRLVWEELTLPNIDSPICRLVRHSAFIFGMAHEHDESLEALGMEHELRDLLHQLTCFCILNSFDILEVAEANIKKIRKRYPNGFSPEAAINRDKTHELSHIG